MEYLTVFFVILGCNSVFYVREGVNHITEIVMILSVVLTAVELYSMPVKIGILQKYVAWLLPYLCLVAVLVFVNVQKEALVSFCGRYAVFLPMMTLVFVIFRKQGNPNRLLYVYSNIMTVVAVISLFFWIFGTMLHLIHPTGHMPGSWGGKFNYPLYFNLYFERQVDLISGWSRNQGIFAEAPMYSLNLVFAIASVLLLSEPSSRERKIRIRLGDLGWHIGKSDLRLAILIMALVSTFSTTGIILLIAMLYGKYLLGTPKTAAKWRLKYIFSGIFGVAAAACAIYLFKEKSSTFSWSERAGGFATGFRIWMDSPIFGQGYSINESYVGTNSLFEVLTFGGILFGSIYIFPMTAGILSSLARHEKSLLIFHCVVFADFILTICGRTFMMLFMLSYFYSNLIFSLPVRKVPGLANAESGSPQFTIAPTAPPSSS